MPNVTYVSMLIRTDSNPVDANQRLAWLQPLIALNIPLVLFVDSFFAPLVAPLPKGQQVIIHSLEFANLQMTRDILAASPQLPPRRNTQKDTIQYMCLMNAKPEIVWYATVCGHVKTPFVAYIDSGISKIFKTPATIKELETISLCNIPFLLLPGCHQPHTVSHDELARQINWTYCGGFFALPTEQATRFAELHRAAVQTFLDKSRITWEVNVWTHWLSSRPDVIWYSGPHDDTMITGIPALKKFNAAGTS